MRNTISNTSTSDKKKRCPTCGKRWPPDFRWCQHDGTGLIPDYKIDDPTSAVGMCRCGAMAGFRNDKGMCTAPNCGRSLQTARAHDEMPFGSEFAGVTDVGRRHRFNEDNLDMMREEIRGSNAYVMAVCDGVSSSENAAGASQAAALTACSKILKCVKAGLSTTEAMTRALLFAHKEVILVGAKAKTKGEKDPPESTIVAGFVHRGQATIGWVGDSRAYLLIPGTKGEILQLTKDHSVGQELLDKGMTAKAAKEHPDFHKITQCLGATYADGKPEPIKPGVITLPLPPQSILILCSDGLWNNLVEPAQLLWLTQKALVQPGADAASVSRQLVEHALVTGGGDNITVVTLMCP